MDIFGSFALLLAFLAAVYAFGAGIAGILTRRTLLTKSARNAGMAVFVLVTLAVASLEYFFFTDDFSMAYVAAHSNKALPAFYKFAALWAGQEGSLLWWSFLLSIYAFLALFLNRNRHPELMPYVGVTLSGVQIFFLTLNNFVASPFHVMASADSAGVFHLAKLSEGSGLNPLLQYPEMVIHPPMLYLGYTGFTIPFAFALAALLGRYPGEKWIHITRRWTMVAWTFQTIGVLLGAHWAYAVLGWGGYWGWDPVENAALLPWITGTAFLHSVMMQEKRGMMKVWNVWLVFVTFMLCILGTMLTRSGIVNSVHAFAESSIGGWFVGFLIIIFLVCLGAWYKNRDYLRSDNQLDSIVSRESSFLFNNLILLAACFAILWGTLFPVLSEWVTGSKISVGPPFFNKVNVPIALFLVAFDWSWSAARVAQDFVRRAQAKFRVAACGRSDRGRHCLRFRLPEFLRADLPDSIRVCDAHDCVGILSWRARDCVARRSEHYHCDGRSYDAQHSSLRWLRRSFWHGAHLYRHHGIRVQSGRAEGDGRR